MRELNEIRANYDKYVNSTDKKTMRIDVDDYIALLNMAEYSEIIEREQETERKEADKMDAYYWGDHDS